MRSAVTGVIAHSVADAGCDSSSDKIAVAGIVFLLENVEVVLGC